MLPIFLTFGAINALVPLMVIIILIAAGAGLMRGYDIFTILGISTLAGIGRATSSKGSLKKTSNPKPLASALARKAQKGGGGGGSVISNKIGGAVKNTRNKVFAGTGLMGTTSNSAQVRQISNELKTAAGVKPTNAQQARKLATSTMRMATKGAAMIGLPGLVGTNKRLASKKDAEVRGVSVGSVIDNALSIEQIHKIEQRNKLRYVGPSSHMEYPRRSLESDLNKLKEEIKERNVTKSPPLQPSAGYPEPTASHGTAPMTDKQIDDRVRSLLKQYTVGGAPIIHSSTKEKFNDTVKAIRNTKKMKSKVRSVITGFPHNAKENIKYSNTAKVGYTLLLPLRNLHDWGKYRKDVSKAKLSGTYTESLKKGLADQKQLRYESNLSKFNKRMGHDSSKWQKEYWEKVEDFRERTGAIGSIITHRALKKKAEADAEAATREADRKKSEYVR